MKLSYLRVRILLAVLLGISWTAPAMADNLWLSANGIRTDNVTLNGAAVDNSTYHADPPFVTTNVPPNVMIVLDNSGSMNDQAYAGSYNPNQFANGQYYGYFDSASCYVYQSNQWRVLGAVDPTTGCASFAASLPASTTNPVASGNFLNWATMRRVDIAKKLLIGGEANPRSVSPGQTVKLTGESGTNINGWDFSKDYNGTTGGFGVTFYMNNTGNTGNYRYSMDSSESLRAAPLIAGTDTITVYPNGTINAGGWTATCSSPHASCSNVHEAVDETTSDGDTSTIKTTSTTTPVLLDYKLSGASLGSITSVTIKVVARRSSNSTMRIRGVFQMNNVNYESNRDSLTNSYATYQFSWNNNPQTGLPWQWTDLKTTGPAALNAFGVRADTTPDASNYPIITQVYLVITSASPTGGPYGITVDTGRTQVSGIVDNLSTEARFGLAYYANSSNGGYISVDVDFNTLGTMATSIFQMHPSTWTPLAETFYEVVRYFRQAPPYDNATYGPYYSNSPADYKLGTNYDPYYYRYSAPLSPQYVPCAKTFILMITDGESTMDQNVPDIQVPFPGGGNRSLRDYNQDGKDPGSYASSGSDYLDDIAYWARVSDARSDLSENQNIILYSVYLFGRGSDLLKRAAIYGGFDDIRGDSKPACLYPAVPGNPTQAELAACYRDSNGDGTLNPSTDLPLTYYEGDDGYELQGSIVEAIAAILKRASSGTSVSVLGSSWKGQGALYQAYFYPEKTRDDLVRVKWTGYLQSLLVDVNGRLHEDTNGDHALTAQDDKVVNITYNNATKDTVVEFYWDKNGDGVLDSASPFDTQPLTKLKPVWDAGKLLAAHAASSRNIYTTINNSSVIPFNSANAASLRPYIRGADNTAADKLVRFIRGEYISGWRDRRISVDDTALCSPSASPCLMDWKLGDIVFSDPIVVQAPNEGYQDLYKSPDYAAYLNTWLNRRAVIYVGTNDGMLHAFNGGFSKVIQQDTIAPTDAQVTFYGENPDVSPQPSPAKALGEELWAFIPYGLLPHLAWLADPDYQHVFYVDQTVRVTDVRIFTPDADHVQGWGTIMIVGLRMGGGQIDVTDDFGSGPQTKTFKSAYYVFDVTNPDVLPPKLLWRFTDNDLGFTTVLPTFMRQDVDTNRNNGNEKWFLIFGSGPTNYKGGRVISTNNEYSKFSGVTTTNPQLYILNLQDDTSTGQLAGQLAGTTHSTSGRVGVIRFPETGGFNGNVTSIDYLLKDFNTDVAYTGTSFCSGTCDSYGTPSSNGHWAGNMYRIVTFNSTDPANWVRSQVFSADRPIIAKASLAVDRFGKMWVYFGTGRFMHVDERFNQDQQTFYGMKDPCWDGSCTTSVLKSNLMDVTGIDVLTTGQLYAAAPIVYKSTTFTDFPTLETFMLKSGDGWYRNMTASGERVFVNGLVIGGLVTFGSYTPSNDICSFEGLAKQYFPYYLTGTAYYNPQMNTFPYTYTSGGGTAISYSGGSTPGVPSPPAVHVNAKGETRVFVQNSTGAINILQIFPPQDIAGGRYHWIEKIGD